MSQILWWWNPIAGKEVRVFSLAHLCLDPCRCWARPTQGCVTAVLLSLPWKDFTKAFIKLHFPAAESWPERSRLWSSTAVCYERIPDFLRTIYAWRGKGIEELNAVFAFSSTFTGLQHVLVCSVCAPAEKLFLDPAGILLLCLLPVVYKSFRRFAPFNSSTSSLEGIEEGSLP